ncbi:hypothetical protein BO71DRAFT_435228 [Aspergillus ellipticus CBS 707.79]|uniref:Uncharacterized protein n=1 Tax=Aspergillus ellipticus CBS 707.79 TaxID=1448320 RepID=A0A319DDB0_9EURO|nr:hypothetical protein BO71DRAFT_435228 [Aspergillus ellipticus CBS 707.79]
MVRLCSSEAVASVMASPVRSSCCCFPLRNLHWVMQRRGQKRWNEVSRTSKSTKRQSRPADITGGRRGISAPEAGTIVFPAAARDLGRGPHLPDWETPLPTLSAVFLFGHLSSRALLSTGPFSAS